MVWPFLPVLLRGWTVPARGGPDAAYRAERRATVAESLAWMLGTVAVGLLGAALGDGDGRWFGAMVPLVLGAGLFFALYGSAYSLLKLSELVLAVQWRERVCFRRLLGEATAAGVLRVTPPAWSFTSPGQPASGPVYQFADRALQELLAGLHAAARAEREAVRARQAARTGVRSSVAAFLTGKRATVIGMDLGLGVMAAAIIVARSTGWADRLGIAFGTILIFCLVMLGVAKFLRGVTQAAAWSLANVPAVSRRLRLAALAVAVAGLLASGTVLLKVVAALLPAAFVAACGGWACQLTWRRLRAPHQGWVRRLRWVPHLLAAATTCASLVVWDEHGRLTAAPLAGLLFPPAVWGSLRIWRAMSGSRLLRVRAAADITLSLLLGAQAVLFLVWLANLLGLSRPEVVAVRAMLNRAGAAADVPAWVWASLYGLLAVAAVA